MDSGDAARRRRRRSLPPVRLPVVTAVAVTTCHCCRHHLWPRSPLPPPSPSPSNATPSGLGCRRPNPLLPLLLLAAVAEPAPAAVTARCCCCRHPRAAAAVVPPPPSAEAAVAAAGAARRRHHRRAAAAVEGGRRCCLWSRRCRHNSRRRCRRPMSLPTSLLPLSAAPARGVDCWLDPPLPPSAPAGGHLLGRGHWHRAIPGNFRPLPAAAGRAHHAGASAVLVNPAFNPPLPPFVARRCLCCGSWLTRA